MKDSRTLRKLLLTSTLLILSSVIAVGVYTQASKSEEKQPARRRTYDAAKVTTPPEVKSKIKGGMKSLRVFLETHPKSTYGVKISENAPSKHGNLEEIPLYGLAGWKNWQS